MGRHVEARRAPARPPRATSLPRTSRAPTVRVDHRGRAGRSSTRSWRRARARPGRRVVGSRSTRSGRRAGGRCSPTTCGRGRRQPDRERQTVERCRTGRSRTHCRAFACPPRRSSRCAPGRVRANGSTASPAVGRSGRVGTPTRRRCPSGHLAGAQDAAALGPAVERTRGTSFRDRVDEVLAIVEDQQRVRAAQVSEQHRLGAAGDVERGGDRLGDCCRGARRFESHEPRAGEPRSPRATSIARRLTHPGRANHGHEALLVDELHDLVELRGPADQPG